MQEIILKNNHSEYFTLITYPDGQHSIKLNLEKIDVKQPVSIKCRIRNFRELEVLLCLVTSLKKYDFCINKIFFVYLFGMRSDRAFEVGQPNYFKDVVKPILKLLDCNLVFLSPHNLNQIENFEYIKIDINPNITYSIAGDYSFYKIHSYMLDGYFEKNRKEKIEIKLHHKTKTTKISDYKEILILDDLCDGGATFIAEGEYIKKHFYDKTLKLFVCHGLFTQGIHHLLSYFDEIICTNSYQDIDHTNVKQIKVI